MTKLNYLAIFALILLESGCKLQTHLNQATAASQTGRCISYQDFALPNQMAEAQKSSFENDRVEQPESP
jgi:hypothetical protein